MSRSIRPAGPTVADESFDHGSIRRARPEAFQPLATAPCGKVPGLGIGERFDDHPNGELLAHPAEALALDQSPQVRAAEQHDLQAARCKAGQLRQELQERKCLGLQRLRVLDDDHEPLLVRRLKHGMNALDVVLIGVRRRRRRILGDLLQHAAERERAGARIADQNEADRLVCHAGECRIQHHRLADVARAGQRHERMAVPDRAREHGGRGALRFQWDDLCARRRGCGHGGRLRAPGRRPPPQTARPGKAAGQKQPSRWSACGSPTA